LEFCTSYSFICKNLQPFCICAVKLLCNIFGDYVNVGDDMNFWNIMMYESVMMMTLSVDMCVIY